MNTQTPPVPTDPPPPPVDPETLAMLSEQGMHLTDEEAALVAAWCGRGQP